jgi:hypothetical protein
MGMRRMHVILPIPRRPPLAKEGLYPMPHLAQWLTQTTPGSLSTSSAANTSADDRVFAQALKLSQWPPSGLPWAAWRAQQQGLIPDPLNPPQSPPEQTFPWAFMHLCHWQCTWQAITLWPLDESALHHPVFQRIVDALQDIGPALFAPHGLQFHDDRPGRYLLTGPSFPIPTSPALSVMLGCDVTSVLPRPPYPLGKVLNTLQMAFTQVWREAGMDPSSPEFMGMPNAIWIDRIGALSSVYPTPVLPLDAHSTHAIYEDEQGHWHGPGVCLLNSLMAPSWEKIDAHLAVSPIPHTASAHTPTHLTLCQGSHALHLNSLKRATWLTRWRRLLKQPVWHTGHPLHAIQTRFDAL